ncbi:MAG: hypothetical protein KTR24_01555 [Saprospiraceae bacterium]|nr:hypothetical protein [Saprospiraceae bacterium]
MEEAQLEQIQQYLDGHLKGDQLIAFEARLAEDAALAAQVRELKDIDLSLESIGVDHFQKRMEAWEEEHVSGARQDRSGKYASRWAMAAIALVLIGVSLFILPDAGPDGRSLYAAYFEPYPNLVTSRSEEHSEKLIAGMMAYDNLDYAQACTTLADYLVEKPEDRLAMLYLAIGLIREGKHEEAQGWLDKSKTNTLYQEQAEWYTLLNLLASEQLEEAQSYASTLLKKEDHYKLESIRALYDQVIRK